MNEPSIKNGLVSDETQSGAVSPAEQTTPTETPTTNPAIVRTATIAAQLTSVAEFQKTVTSVP